MNTERKHEWVNIQFLFFIVSLEQYRMDVSMLQLVLSLDFRANIANPPSTGQKNRFDVWARETKPLRGNTQVEPRIIKCIKFEKGMLFSVLNFKFSLYFFQGDWVAIVM